MKKKLHGETQIQSLQDAAKDIIIKQVQHNKHSPLQRHLEIHWVRKNHKRFTVSDEDDVDDNQTLKQNQDILQ